MHHLDKHPGRRGGEIRTSRADIVKRRVLLPCASLLLLALSPALAGEEAKTVLGPDNIYLYDGANALMAHDGKEGVRLTLLGLNTASNARERKVAHSNLCAGFLLINELEKALTHCNWVIERDARHWRTYNNRALVLMRLERFDEAEEDIRKGQALRPNSKKLKIVKGMYLDETQPVTPKIEIDERRQAAKGADDRPADIDVD